MRPWHVKAALGIWYLLINEYPAPRELKTMCLADVQGREVRTGEKPGEFSAYLADSDSRVIVSRRRLAPPGTNNMKTIDDFRIEAHELLLELEAATTGLMMLVSSKCISGPAWDAATIRQHEAYDRWSAFVNITTEFAPD